mgnify:CR=1 FL=1
MLTAQRCSGSDLVVASRVFGWDGQAVVKSGAAFLRAAIPALRLPIPHEIRMIPKRLHTASFMFDHHVTHLCVGRRLQHPAAHRWQ